MRPSFVYASSMSERNYKRADDLLTLNCDLFREQSKIRVKLYNQLKETINKPSLNVVSWLFSLLRLVVSLCKNELKYRDEIKSNADRFPYYANAGKMYHSLAMMRIRKDDERCLEVLRDIF